MVHTCGPCDTACAATHRHGPREADLHRETAHGRGIPRALAILQKRPRTSPKLQLSTNTIFSSLRTSHLTPWLSWNSPARTPVNSVHGGAASGGTGRLRRPPGTCVGPPNGSITISDPSGYTKRGCRVTRLAGEGCSGTRPSTTVAPLFR